MSLITAKNLSVALNGRTVLQNVDLSISSAEILTVIGPNGSGKTTLLRSLIGSITPLKGALTRQAGLRIGYVPQKLHIDATLPLTVSRFMALPRRMPAKDLRAAAAQAGLGHVSQAQLSQLSGGQFQRVLLARALLCRPQLLILDEPTQGLDHSGAAAFYRQIETVRQETGCAVLLVSHDLHVVMAASDRVICLNGHVCCQGSPEQVASSPEYQTLFGASTDGAMALYRHEHDHDHDHEHDDHHDHHHNDHPRGPVATVTGPKVAPDANAKELA